MIIENGQKGELQPLLIIEDKDLAINEFKSQSLFSETCTKRRIQITCHAFCLSNLLEHDDLIIYLYPRNVDSLQLIQTWQLYYSLDN